MHKGHSVACATCILIDVRCPRFSFILRHARECGGEIGEILRRHESGPRTVAHSFIYFLTYRCTRSCSRFIGAGSSPHGLHLCPYTTRFRASAREEPNSRNGPQGENAPENENGFPAVVTVERAIVTVLHFPKSAVVKLVGSCGTSSLITDTNQSRLNGRLQIHGIGWNVIIASNARIEQLKKTEILTNLKRFSLTFL